MEGVPFGDTLCQGVFVPGNEGCGEGRDVAPSCREDLQPQPGTAWGSQPGQGRALPSPTGEGRRGSPQSQILGSGEEGWCVSVLVSEGRQREKKAGAFLEKFPTQA